MKLKISKEIIISDSSRTLLVAEISANHCGSRKRFFEHIIKAKKFGADLVKIQTYEENDISANLRNLNKNYKLKNNFDIYKKSKTNFSWHKEAFDLAKKKKIILFSSPFSIRSVNLLESLNCPIYKIASLEMTDYSLIERIAKTKKPIIISTGASYINEVQKALKVINKHHNRIIILYCRSTYPLKEEDSNLSIIQNFKKKFKKNFIGYSDHTKDNITSLIASNLGAKRIEKHFIIDEKKTYDSSFSIKPNQLLKLKNDLIKNHEIIGHKKHYLLKDEKNKRKYRRSLFAIRDIKVGEKFTEKNIVSLRPKIGVCASKYLRLLNKKSKRRYLKNHPINQNEIL